MNELYLVTSFDHLDKQRVHSGIRPLKKATFEVTSDKHADNQDFPPLTGRELFYDKTSGTFSLDAPLENVRRNWTHGVVNFHGIVRKSFQVVRFEDSIWLLDLNKTIKLVDCTPKISQCSGILKKWCCFLDTSGTISMIDIWQISRDYHKNKGISVSGNLKRLELTKKKIDGIEISRGIIFGLLEGQSVFKIKNPLRKSPQIEIKNPAKSPNFKKKLLYKLTVVHCSSKRRVICSGLTLKKDQELLIILLNFNLEFKALLRLENSSGFREIAKLNSLRLNNSIEIIFAHHSTLNSLTLIRSSACSLQFINKFDFKTPFLISTCLLTGSGRENRLVMGSKEGKEGHFTLILS